MPNVHNNNLPLCMTIALGMLNACVGPQGWFAMWNGIKDISAYIADLIAGVAAVIRQTTAALGVSFGKYLYDQLAVAKLLHVVTTTGTWLQATGIVVSGLLVSYAVLAFGYSVWTFGVCSNTVSQQVLSMHVVYVFLPLVLASIVFGLVGFDIEDQGAPIIEGQLGLNSNQNNNGVAQGNGTSSNQCLVRTNNNDLVRKPDTGKEMTKDSSAKTGKGGEVAYGDDTRKNGGTPSDYTTGGRKRGHAETGTENETDSDDNRDPPQRRKVAGSEVAYPYQTAVPAAVQADKMDTSE